MLSQSLKTHLKTIRASNDLVSPLQLFFNSVQQKFKTSRFRPVSNVRGNLGRLENAKRRDFPELQIIIIIIIKPYLSVLLIGEI